MIDLQQRETAVQAVVNLTHLPEKASHNALSGDDGIVPCDFCAEQVIDFVPTKRGISCYNCVRSFVEIVCEDLDNAISERRVALRRLA